MTKSQENANRPQFSTLTNTISLRADLSAFSTADKVNLTQQLLRELVLPQTHGEIAGQYAVINPELENALNRVWSALNASL